MNTTMTMTMDSIRDARGLLRWAAIGVVPSQPVAEAARNLVRDFARSDAGDVVDVSEAAKVLGYCSMGVVPSLARSLHAIKTLDRAIEAQEDLSTSSLRERFMRQRG